MSQTKAAKIIEATHDNDLTSSLLKALIENDNDLLLSALYDANLDIDDVTLSDTELDHFVKGVKPSGELDITTWDGYYEASNQDDLNVDDRPTFLIVSTTKGVYWGSRSDIMSIPGNYAMDYTLTLDGKINFSTINGDHISITLIRTLDKATDDFSVTFSAVYNGQSISGGKVAPPLRSSDHLIGQTSTVFNAFSPETTYQLPPDKPYTWHDAFTDFGTACSIYGVLHLLGGRLIRWVRATVAERAEQSRRIRGRLEDGHAVEKVELLTKDRIGSLDVDFSSAARQLKEEVTSAINDRLEEIGDWNRDAREIVQDLRPVAEATGKETLENYVKTRIGSFINQSLSPFESMQVYRNVKETVLDEAVKSRVDPKIDALRSTTYDPLLHSLTLEAQKRAFSKDYKMGDGAYKAVESAYEEAAKARELTQKDLNEIEERIRKAREDQDKEREAELKDRREKLEDKLEKDKQLEREKDQKRREVERARDEAAKKSQEAEERAKKDAKEKSRRDWERKVEGIFK